MTDRPLDDREIRCLRAVAAVLIPGDGQAPPAVDLPEIDDLLQRAAVALGPDLPALHEAVAAVPDDVDFEALEAFSDRAPEPFSLIGTTVSGAYFMAPAALEAIGYPTGPRSAPPFDLAADELTGGILEPVIERGFDGP